MCERERKDTRMNKTAHIELRRNKFSYVYVTKKLKNANGSEITALSEKRRRIGKTEKYLFEIVII